MTLIDATCGLPRMAIVRDVIDQPGPVPAPRLMERRWGRLDLRRGLVLVAPEGAGVGVRRLLRRHQRRLDELLGPPRADAIRLRTHVQQDFDRAPALGDDESFELRVTSAQVELDAATPIGVSHALERVLQLVARDAQGPHLPAMRLEDAPRFPWRGLLLDLARHHLPLPALLRTLDGMAALGLNVLHLHLNDDQGFRVETASCPELFERSSDGEYLREAELERLSTGTVTRLEVTRHGTAGPAPATELEPRGSHVLELRASHGAEQERFLSLLLVSDDGTIQEIDSFEHVPPGAIRSTRVRWRRTPGWIPAAGARERFYAIVTRHPFRLGGLEQRVRGSDASDSLGLAKVDLLLRIEDP